MARKASFKPDYVLATALRGSASLQCETKLKVVSEAKDNFRKDDDPALRDRQSRGAIWATGGCPQGERGGVHQFGVPPKVKGNPLLANASN